MEENEIKLALVGGRHSKGGFVCAFTEKGDVDEDSEIIGA